MLRDSYDEQFRSFQKPRKFNNQKSKMKQEFGKNFGRRLISCVYGFGIQS